MSEQTHNTQFRRMESTEAALRLSEATKTAILDAALDCIVTIDHRGIVLDWNPAAVRTFGYTASEAVGREMAELIIPPHFREMHRQGVARAVKSAKDLISGKRIEITALRKSGEEFPVELAITRIAAGPAPLFTGHIRDISARKQAEQRRVAELNVVRILADANGLAEAAPKVLRAVCESLQWDLGVMWRVDEGRSALRCFCLWHAPHIQAEAFVSATKTSRFEPGVGLPGRIWATRTPQWIPDVTHDLNFPRLKLADETKLHAAFGFPLRLGEEVLGVIEFFSRQIREPHTEVLDMFSAIGSQIGQFIERNEAEEALYRVNSDLERRVADATAELRASQERFHKAFHASPAVMALIRQTDSCVVDANEAFCALTGFAADQVVGQTIQQLGIWPETAACRRFLEQIRGRTAIRERELELRSRSGKMHPVLVTSEIIELERKPHLLIVALDISVRKRAELELRVALEQEKELSRLKTNFVNLVSHEFRTPLGVILSASDILENYFERLTPQQRGDHLQDIRNATEAMAGLMEEVLLLGRVEAGKMECKPDRFHLPEFCRRIVDEQCAAEKNKCPIKLSLAEECGEVCGDEGLLRHIFANLLSNSIKYSPAGRPVSLSVRRAQDDAVLQVRDQGIGIPSEDQKRLFEAFHRGSNVGETPGTGLGMVIVKRCVDLHGGGIKLESRVGQGTVVTVTLPPFKDLAGATPSSTSRGKRRAVPRRRGKEHA